MLGKSAKKYPRSAAVIGRGKADSLFKKKLDEKKLEQAFGPILIGRSPKVSASKAGGVLGTSAKKYSRSAAVIGRGKADSLFKKKLDEKKLEQAFGPILIGRSPKVSASKAGGVLGTSAKKYSRSAAVIGRGKADSLFKKKLDEKKLEQAFGPILIGRSPKVSASKAGGVLGTSAKKYSRSAAVTVRGKADSLFKKSLMRKSLSKLLVQ